MKNKKLFGALLIIASIAGIGMSLYTFMGVIEGHKKIQIINEALLELAPESSVKLDYKLNGKVKKPGAVSLLVLDKDLEIYKDTYKSHLHVYVTFKVTDLYSNKVREVKIFRDNDKTLYIGKPPHHEKSLEIKVPKDIEPSMQKVFSGSDAYKEAIYIDVPLFRNLLFGVEYAK